MIAHFGHSSNRPSILLLITDQQRYDAVGYTNPLVKTPNIDTLAKESINFLNIFVQSPQCQPSRASIFTGRYPTAHRLWWNGTNLSRKEMTISKCLQNNGYHTAYFGKFDLSKQPNPKHYGFDYSYLYEDWIETAKFNKPTIREFTAPMTKSHWTGEFASGNGHHDEEITTAAISHLKNNQGRNLFTVVGFHGPHPPYAAPRRFSDLYRNSKIPLPKSGIKAINNYEMTNEDWRNLKIQYYGSCSWIDDCVGRILKSVDNNTIIVYMSDHGDILGDHGYFSKGLYAYEGNIRIPLLIRFPDRRAAVKYELAQSIDLMPTLLSAIGISLPKGVQGIDLLGNKINNYVTSMIGYNQRLRMVRNSNYKYWICDDEEHLYDLRHDLKEESMFRNDLVLSKMRLLLVKALINSEDSLPQPTIR